MNSPQKNRIVFHSTFSSMWASSSRQTGTITKAPQIAIKPGSRWIRRLVKKPSSTSAKTISERFSRAGSRIARRGWVSCTWTTESGLL